MSSVSFAAEELNDDMKILKKWNATLLNQITT